ncbi:MAG: hypothetical protein AUH31_03040 [Armatimonadetes bacterium 13_1_40CM_64_14]|nr:MAG: hypothetical protein AUH31_03040 [Armatimonadetes bacterium 13_1_40CM_64_14]
MRVHELAKDLGLSSKAMVDLLASMNISVKSHSSTLDDATVARVRRKAKGQDQPKPEPSRVAKTASGERILGMRKITPPPPPPEPVPVQETLASAPVEELPGQEMPGKPSAEPAVKVKPATTEVVMPSRPAVVGPTDAEGRPVARPGQPAAAPKVITKDFRTPMRPAASAGTAAPARPLVRPTPPRRDTPRPQPPRAPVEPGAAPSPAPAPVGAPPKERPPKVKERLPPPPPPAPVAAPPVVTAEIELPGPLTVGELAVKLGLGPGDVVKRLLEQRVLAGINQQIPLEAAAKVAESFGSKVRKPEGMTAGVLTVAAPKRLEVARDDAAVPRPPVVTILGHVDHGKTSLLDAIRQTDVAAREFGGITQHIGASTVDVDSRRIVFIDTPGHEAFTTLRARGAQVTDIAVLVVAADDGVMPQTIEALNHAKAAGVPIVVAINKVDLPQANPDRVKQQLSDAGLVPEDWGGDTVTVPVSARTRQGLKELLEMILLVTDLQEHRANPSRPARGTILETRLDRGRGPVATVLVQEGTLRVGDAVVAGSTSGRVRAMTNDRGERLTEALPATPVEVVGLDDVPTAGDVMEAVGDEKEAKVVAEERRLRARAGEAAATRGVEEAVPAAGEAKELRVLLKADSHGAVEALSTSLARLASPEVGVTVLHAAVGNVTESDVMLAAASRAIIIGFNIRPEPPVRKLAEQEHIDILTYRIIYEALDDIKNRLRGMRAPKRVEVSLGQAAVLKTFTISKVGTIAGCSVNAGVITRSATVRVIRDGVVVHEGKISSLRRFKEDVREVAAGFECGIGLERFPDMKVGDILEAFEIREEPA